MKCLELKVIHQECHGLAMTLVGSPTATKKTGGEDCLFIGIRQRLTDKTFVTDISGEEKEILLPLSTLKFCPYVAMREGVDIYDPMTDQRGEIESIITKNEIWLKREGDGDGSPIDLKNITLDLENLPKGAEIVEVKE